MELGPNQIPKPLLSCKIFFLEMFIIDAVKQQGSGLSKGWLHVLPVLLQLLQFPPTDQNMNLRLVVDSNSPPSVCLFTV